ncbi:MAG: hydrogenase nickel incorporation protein HypA [Candidatus Bathyarchaeota archaeon]|nr:hydrogenase nickel incorporation protein HypA [Candidatus Bathyarchaeota archaeon]
MHEWALAEAIIAAAEKIAVKEKLREVKEVTIKVGELQQVEEDILRFALSQLKPSSFKNAEFHITKARTALRCRTCGNSWLFRRNKLDEATAEAIHFVPEVAHSYIKCPKCGSPDFEITEGRGVWLENIKGVR